VRGKGNKIVKLGKGLIRKREIKLCQVRMKGRQVF
jgi:hypothetical protein